MNWFARWRRARILKSHALPQDAFSAAVARLPILNGLSLAELAHLRDLAALFLHGKTFSAAGEARVDDTTQLSIALQACLLILHLDEASYRGWNEIILYPDEFLHPREEIDEAGVVHHSRDILAGESWLGGPLVLSIADVNASGRLDGVNVVLHEFAHKLDMLNGDANGFPPLHRGMNAAAWACDFSAAYEDLCARVDAGEDTAIDPYAATDPAEFFAVLSEVFFETPTLLQVEYPAIYQQMRLFYRQHPLARLAGEHMSQIQPRTAARMDDIAPFHVMDILARAQALEAAGRDIIHLEIGEPDFATPLPIIEAGIAALRAGHTHYTGALGLPALRKAIAGFYATRWQLEVAASRIVVTPGASGALLLALGLLAGPGDEVLMADPGYPCNRHFARFCDARVVTIPVDADSGFQLMLRHIERHATPATRAVLIASPSNPTGTAISPAELTRIHDWCGANDVAMIVDEIYLALTYDGDEYSAARWDDVFVINSFSKYFLMTGWRLGWLAAPAWAMGGLERLTQNLFLAASTPAQHAALAAFSAASLAELEDRKTELRTRRDYLLPALRKRGFAIPIQPQGAFYLYADCRALTHDSFDWAQTLLETVGVAVTPGLDFGQHRAQHYVRIAYTQPLPRLVEAIARLDGFFSR